MTTLATNAAPVQKRSAARRWWVLTLVLTAVILGGVVGWARLRCGSFAGALAYAAGDRIVVREYRQSFGAVALGQARTVTAAHDLPRTIPARRGLDLPVQVTMTRKRGDVAEHMAILTDLPGQRPVPLVLTGHVLAPDEATQTRSR